MSELSNEEARKKIEADYLGLKREQPKGKGHHFRMAILDDIVPPVAPAHSGNKYHRTIHGVTGGETTVDVYCVLEAFAVACPARQHAIKKLLCAGIRGKGDSTQDLRECRDAVDRAIELEAQRHPGHKESTPCQTPPPPEPLLP